MILKYLIVLSANDFYRVKGKQTIVHFPYFLII